MNRIDRLIKRITELKLIVLNEDPSETNMDLVKQDIEKMEQEIKLLMQ